MIIRGQHWWMRAYIATIGILFVCCAMAHIGGAFNPESMSARAGMVSNCAELEARNPAPPEEENAATHYARAYDKATLALSHDEWRLLPGWGQGDWPCYPATLPANALAALGAVIAQAQPALDELRAAAAAPAAYYPVCQADKADWIPFVETRDCGRFLKNIAYYYALSGQPAEACESLELLAAIARALGTASTMPYIYGDVVSSLEKAWNETQLRLTFDEAQLQRIAAAFDRIPALRPEVAVESQSLSAIEWNRPENKEPEDDIQVLWPEIDVTQWLIFWPANKCMQVHAVYLSKTPNGVAEIKRINAALTSPGFRNNLAELISSGAYYLGSYAYDYSAHLSFRSKEYTLRAAQLKVSAALARYRAAQGAFPETLDALVPEYLADIPEDPDAAPAPLRYLRTETGYVLHGIGPNGVDDLGENDYRDERDDLALVFPLKTEH